MTEPAQHPPALISVTSTVAVVTFVTVTSRDERENAVRAAMAVGQALAYASQDPDSDTGFVLPVELPHVAGATVTTFDTVTVGEAVRDGKLSVQVTQRSADILGGTR